MDYYYQKHIFYMNVTKIFDILHSAISDCNMKHTMPTLLHIDVL